MIVLENDHIKVAIKPLGAELHSLINIATGLDYMWSGDVKYWAKQSPVLFPIIGTLKNDTFFFDDKSYHLNRHGFAREKTFSVSDQTSSSVVFTLLHDAETLLVYPFKFSFSIIYTIVKSKLSVTYLVKNIDEKTIFFSVGGHPAFKMPLNDNLNYEDYYFEFNEIENLDRWPISSAGLIEETSLVFLENSQRIDLSKSLFNNDAIVLKNVKSNTIKVLSDKDTAGFAFTFDNFPYLGIWAAKDADFICIEPWCGIADSVGTTQSLIEKEGIVQLIAGESFKRNWDIEIW